MIKEYKPNIDPGWARAMEEYRAARALNILLTIGGISMAPAPEFIPKIRIPANCDGCHSDFMAADIKSTLEGAGVVKVATCPHCRQKTQI